MVDTVKCLMKIAKIQPTNNLLFNAVSIFVVNI